MTDQEKSFIESCFDGDLRAVKTCVKYGVDIHTENDWCIDIAARKGHSKLIRFLLENGITHESASKKSVLAYAAHHQDKPLVKYLISQSDDYKNDSAALSWAAMKEDVEIFESLLVYVSNFGGVFCRAAEAGNVALIEILINNGIQDLDKGSIRAPYWAAEKSKWAAVYLLLSNNIGDIDNLGDLNRERYLEWKNKKLSPNN